MSASAIHHLFLSFRCHHLPRQLKLHRIFLTVLPERPRLGDVVFILEGNGQIVPMAVRGLGQIGGIHKRKADDVVLVGAIGTHAGLVHGS